MVNALIEIIDRLISLVKGRIQSRRDMFDKVLEPTFNDLLLIHGDYIKIFEDANYLLHNYLEDEGSRVARSPFWEPEKGSKEYIKRIEVTREEIRKRRLEFEPVRIKIRILAKELRKRKFPLEETVFIKNVLNYFPTADPRARSECRNILEQLKYTKDIMDIANIIGVTIHRHKESWSDVCEAFAILKIKIAELR